MTIAVDFDGTICTNEYPKCGKINRDVVRKLIKLRSRGNKIILWTCRTDRELDEAVEYCRKYGLEFDKVNENLDSVVSSFGGDTRKLVADFYVDDRNLTPVSFLELL